MKSTIITCAVKLAIAILQYILGKYSKEKETNFIQDVQINESASKMFKEFIDSHTKKSDSDGNGEGSKDA